MKCKHDYKFSRHCGTWVCTECGDHRKLTRCYCGWSVTRPGQGRQELEEMGEVIDPEED